MPRSTQSAQPALEFIPPALDLTTVRSLQALLPLITRSRTAITHIEAEHVDRLVNLYQQFQAGKIRFLMAFRHPSADDPLCLAHLLSRSVPQTARQRHTTLQTPIHAHFIYDRGIPLWAGSFMGWLYSRLGGTPIHRGKLDRVGLRSARDLFANGSLPMAAAPEGATNGHSEIISPLEPGIAQLGFWCAEDLLKAGRSEQVFLVPIGIQYRYVTPPWKAIAQLLAEIEHDVGLTNTTSSLDDSALYHRLYRLGEHLLTQMEQYYTRFYHQTLPPVASAIAGPDQAGLHPPGSNEEFNARLNALLDVALRVAEQYFNLPAKGSVIDRCRRLEQAGWDYIYREDLKTIDQLSPVERGLADRLAEEASLRLWHMRLVESFVAVTGKYVLERPTVERFAETTLLLWDMVARIKGNSPFKRPKLGKQRALITVGEPISVSDRWEAYQVNRRSAKQAVADLTQDLQVALQGMVR
ncbi:1-acyl-sn-glycerol-3-phosphate acyltransferase [Leptolyngbya sp. FACHB-36]|uniref:1-acyl-sn-glycerol-3-phosphate acyltransferase n=1 Tax=Leptolyngbya sp. FACHB-36 TaxID=2692808 RepID=UPI00168032D4|nr:1-acyl-sn-glycerol-3-phosphate acyltransferase [Leptolyngbya sp. FACHB-36]MBD2018632.1 1-acyl-sn-glycerol-3-phosphate acyltransferase [Leptolyngbya sp. FACHB-36]